MEGIETTFEPDLAVATASVLDEQARRHFDSVRSLLRVGDAVRDLHKLASHGSWTRLLAILSERVGLSVARLEDAARVSSAFPRQEREALIKRFHEAGRTVTSSQLVELARVPPSARIKGLELLLSSPASTRSLRTYLNDHRSTATVTRSGD